jgi:hypothetical protein
VTGERILERHGCPRLEGEDRGDPEARRLAHRETLWDA